jgi:hypothetical protein
MSSHQINASQNYNEIPSHPNENGYHQEFFFDGGDEFNYDML